MPLRVATATAFVLGGALQLTSELLVPPTADYMGWMAAHPGRAEVAAVADLLAVPFLIATTIAWTALARARSKRLAWPGGALMIMGMCGLAALVGATTAQHWLLTLGVDAGTVAKIFDVGGLPLAVQLVMFLGAPLGVILLAVGMWRSRALPRGALALAVAFIVVDFTPMSGVVPFPTHAVLLAALAWMAVAVLRPTLGATAAQPVRAH